VAVTSIPPLPQPNRDEVLRALTIGIRTLADGMRSVGEIARRLGAVLDELAEKMNDEEPPIAPPEETAGAAGPPVGP
jgi:hypothetical protein